MSQDRNVISGQPDPPHFLNQYKSLGEMILKRLSQGGDKVAFVSQTFFRSRARFRNIEDNSVLIPD